MLADPHPQGAALRVRENHEWTQETANKSRSTQRLQRGNAQGFLCLLCALPPPLGVVLPELRRGSPTSLRQGYGGPPKLQRRRKRLRREGGCVQRRLVFHSLVVQLHAELEDAGIFELRGLPPL